MHPLQARQGAAHDRCRGGQSEGAAHVRRRGSRGGRRLERRAVRGEGRPAAHQDDRGDGTPPRRGLHLQHGEVQAAQQPQSGAGRAGRLRAVPQGTARLREAGGDRHAGQVRRAGALARRDADHPPARPVSRIRRHPGDADVPPGLSLAQSAGESEGLGGPAVRDEEAGLGAQAMIAALAAASFVAYAELTGSVDPGSARYLIDAIHDAEAQGAEALIIRMDTPGGLLSSTRDIVQAELSAKVPVVVWVGPPGARAGSAGVFITLAAHVAAMAPSSNIGAAHPVGIGGDAKDPDTQTLVKKIENDTAAFIHGIAERRSRNVDWAEKAVRESVSITASEAVREKVVDLVAEDVTELLKKIDGQKVQLVGGETRRLKTAGAELRPVEWTVRDRVLHALADPQIA